MVMTFDEIKANALRNYKPSPKNQNIIIEHKSYIKIERYFTIFGMGVAIVLFLFGIIL
jgi:hypothetical protein